MTKKFCIALIMLFTLGVCCVSASDEADKYLDYAWQTTRLSSYTARTEAPEVAQNLKALETLCNAEKAERTGKYMNDIINGFWFYAVAHSWSVPAETGYRLPAREGQKPTETSLRTAEMLCAFWPEFSEEINRRAPKTMETLNAAMKRITGKELAK